MIRHIVMWKMKEEHKDKIREMKNRLEALKDHITEVAGLEAGINFSRSDRAYDIALYSVFNTVNDLEAYRIHPEHQAVVAFIGEITESVVAVDYEI